MTESIADQVVPGVKAALAYALTVFSIGFLLGAVRIWLLAPHVGTFAAVSLETPLILAASWYLSSYWLQRFSVGSALRTRLWVGIAAFMVLMALEITLSISLFHRSIAEFLAQLRTPAGALGFAGQIAFASFPLLGALTTRRANRLHRP